MIHMYYFWFVFAEVDYEKQKSYSLTLEAKDGGGRVATVNILIHLSDVNDNAPIFEVSEYRRTVREGATTFQPQFFVRVCIYFVCMYFIYFLYDLIKKSIKIHTSHYYLYNRGLN